MLLWSCVIKQIYNRRSGLFNFVFYLSMVLLYLFFSSDVIMCDSTGSWGVVFDDTINGVSVTSPVPNVFVTECGCGEGYVEKFDQECQIAYVDDEDGKYVHDIDKPAEW